MNAAADVTDPVDPRQRRQARVLGLFVTGAFLALVAVCFTMFSINGLPKDAKEWKRLQERRSAAEADRSTPSVAPASPSITTPQPSPDKDSTR
jgi:hypothetical protein